MGIFKKLNELVLIVGLNVDVREKGEIFENGYSAVGQTCDALEALSEPFKSGGRAGVKPVSGPRASEEE